MKLLCLTVSLVAAFTFEPGPDSQHSIIAEQPQMPEFTVGPGDSEETNLITDEQPQGPGLTFESERLNGNSINSEPQLFDLEEEDEESESELRGSSCKAKLSCSIPGGSCVASGARCYGRLVPAGCKGSCVCCIPECSEKLGFFSPTGSKQCFKFFGDKRRNFTDAVKKCHDEGLVPVHANDPVTLRKELVIRYGGQWVAVWLYARGNGSYFYWQDTKKYIRKYSYNPLWMPNQPSSASSSYCLELFAYDYYMKLYPTSPFYAYGCRNTLYTLCELKL